MRIAICDDDKSELKLFIEALQQWDPTCKPECFFDGASLLTADKKGPPFDIVFLDIYMPGENGVDIAKALRDISSKTGIVFVTTSREHAVDAFSLDALHYLVKPVATEAIAESFRRLRQLRSQEQRVQITLTAGRNSYNVYVDEICCVQIFNHTMEVTLSDGRCIKLWMTLNELLERLGENFLKINRSTAVNMDYIEQMGVDTCLLRNGTRLDLPRREHTAIRNAYNDYIFSHLSRRKDFGSEVER